MEIIKTEKGSLSVLGGKTDMGKSTIACYDCAEQLRSGKSVIFVSYEYCQSIIYTKLVNHSGLRFDELFTGLYVPPGLSALPTYLNPA